MGNVGISIKRFLGNKNTVTILGVIIGIGVLVVIVCIIIVIKKKRRRNVYEVNRVE